MSRLFISYHYTGRQGEQYYTGFARMVAKRLTYAPQTENHLEALESACKKHCMETLGMESAVAVVINWKTMDGL